MTKWVRYDAGNGEAFGALDGERIAEHTGNLFDSPQPNGSEHALDDVTLKTPVAPSKVVALANNFHGLLQKTGGAVPSGPLYFFKANSSLHPHGQPIRRPAGYAGKIIFEGELGLVIGRECRDVGAAEALDYLFGCTCVNDVTAIEILNEDPSFPQWTRCKAADTFGVLGPAVAAGLDPSTLTVTAALDGQQRQNYPITDMVFTPAELISRISRDMTLLPGDVIACGTNVGVGSLRPGNTIEIAIDGIGTLRNVFEPDG